MMLLDELNEVQRVAVAYNDGPQLVIAGAGSGKTRVLTYKIAYLLQQGVEANRILALTFTNKAAREMKERISKLVGFDQARYLWMGTFHSICARILRQEAANIGFTKDFSIYDTSDSQSLIRQIVKEKQLDEKVYKPSVVLNRISAAKNRLCLPDAYALTKSYIDQDRTARMYDMANIYAIYQQRLINANAMDFDDLLVNMCLLLERDEQARSYYQSVFEYVLVDEYQDTNYAQSFIVQRLAAPENKICVVGDDAQSIYSFRGADIANILSFKQVYPNARVDKLERNYRSTQNIVLAANSLIHHNERQIYKETYSENEMGDKVQIVPYASDRDEAANVTGKVILEHRKNGVGYNNIAILYRTNAQSRAFENELRKLAIPYRIYGGLSFYQRKEIKDAICYFRLAANPKDNEALSRVINFPARHIGDTTLRKLSECANVQQVSMLEVAHDPQAFGLTIGPAFLTALKGFASLMDELSEAMETMDAFEYTELMMRRSGIMAVAQADFTPEGQDRLENLNELVSAVREFVDQRKMQGIDFTPITDFLAEVALLTDQDEHTDDKTERVTLMTVHAAKGLEFPVVFIVGMEEDLFPSQYATRASDIEEERRLFYVAITRAMQRCYISFARQRFKNGQLNSANPSRFLKDLDRQYTTIEQPSPSGLTGAAIESRKNSGFPTRGEWGGGAPLGNGGFRGTAIAAEREKAARLSPIKASAPIACKFAIGERVYHKVFGEGKVLSVYRENEVDKIEINFDAVGKKTLLLTYAKLEKR
ncbi:MAG: UvrD-helicase domain-containing protein [Paludibacteraceae bacterium]|nr:UvrD-helicase domain-containing protein [Paludibacteraceae bacterium]